MSPDPILTAFEALARERPGQILVVSPERQATVGAVAALAEALEGRLPSTVGAGDLVTVAVPNGPAFLGAFLALRRRGAAAVLLDGRAREAEARRVARRLGAKLLLASPDGWGPADEFRGVEADNEAMSISSSIAAVKMTSGSTGRPRGILTPSAALVADDAALARTMGLQAGERILAGIPFSHSYGLSSVVLPALMRGSTLVLPETRRPFTLLKAGAALGATFLPTVPAYLEALLKMSRPPACPPSLRLVITAGAPLQAATARAFRERFGLAVHVFYGSSESGGITYDRTGTAGERGTLGTPVEGVEVTLEEDEGGDASEGGSGRVVVRSPAVAEAYWPLGAEELRDGRFKTSDLATFEAGELRLLGRADDVINVKGKKVNPREIEEVLRSLPAVEDAAVFGISTPETRIRAIVAAAPGAVEAQEVLQWCRRHLAEHKVPRSLVLVEALPRNARGKLDRKALEALTP